VYCGLTASPRKQDNRARVGQSANRQLPAKPLLAGIGPHNPKKYWIANSNYRHVFFTPHNTNTLRCNSAVLLGQAAAAAFAAITVPKFAAGFCCENGARRHRRSQHPRVRRRYQQSAIYPYRCRKLNAAQLLSAAVVWTHPDKVG
jgi:hypothetical protein